MSETAFMKQFRDEYIHGFEMRSSLLRQSCTTETVISGNEAEFLVADSGGASTVTRGVNGRIPGRGDNNQQYTCVLSEEHDKVQKTRFNIFASQGNQRAIMQATSQGVVNRRMDDQIIAELNGATNASSAATFDLALTTRILALLGQNEVEYDGNIWAVITPGMLARLQRINEFTSADYISRKPLEGAAASEMFQGYYEWMGIKWIVHPRLPGVGTAAETGFVYHKNAIGHAADSDNMNIAIGYDDEDDYSYARHSIFIGSKRLQEKGIVKLENHNATTL